MRKIFKLCTLVLVVLSYFMFGGDIVFATEVTYLEDINDIGSASGYEEKEEISNLELISSEMRKEEFLELLAVYVQDTEAHGYTKEEMLDSYLGNLYQIPVVTETNEIIYNNNIWHCPIINSGKVMANIDFVIKSNKVFCSISGAYADEMNEYIGKNRVMFFYNDKFICRDTLSGKLDLDNTITEQNFNLTKCDDDKKISTILGNKVEVLSVMYDVEPYILSNYPIRSQGNQPLCWAATIASMVAYEFPSEYSNISMYDVCAVVNCYEGASWDKIQAAMNHYFTSPYVPTAIGASLTREQIQTVIHNNDPALMDSITDDGTSAHATALIGYQITSGSMRVRMMNPATGQEAWTYYDPADKVVYSMNGNEYTWFATIRLLYN